MSLSIGQLQQSNARTWAQAIVENEAAHRAYVLLTITDVAGSAPRPVGTKMVVSDASYWGSIGGGHLEHIVLQQAASLLKQTASQRHSEHFPLGAKLGQCCGGHVTVLFENFPLSLPNIVLFGAGHVGTSLAAMLDQLPCALTWVDSRQESFPVLPHRDQTRIVSEHPSDEVIDMASGSYYIVMTHRHDWDYDIIKAILKRGDARYIGLIGSDTKWRRFQIRLVNQGVSEIECRQVHCPVGIAEVSGKHPGEIAISIAAEFIKKYQSDLATQSGSPAIMTTDSKSQSYES